MVRAVISGIGLHTPEFSVTTTEIINTFNEYLESNISDKQKKLKDIDLRSIQEITGIKHRYLVENKGILDPNIMHPIIKKRKDTELSLQAEIGVKAAEEAIAIADKSVNGIDAVIVACTQSERAYPSIAIEIQNALGIKGFGFDMNVACSSAIFGLQMAYNIINNKQARSVLVVTPEIVSGTVNFRDKDSFFLFGDASVALLVENLDDCNSKEVYEIISTKLFTNFSNNIRCNFGFLNRYDPTYSIETQELFSQNGLQVFRDMIDVVVPQHVRDHLKEQGLIPDDIRLFWLHQANAKMNKFIAQNIFNITFDKTSKRFPMILDEYGNTAAAGCIIAFYKNKLKNINDKGMLCAFGAGYSIGSTIIQKIR